MNSLSPLLALLICPLVMGAMMLYMMRPSKRHRNGPQQRPAPAPVPEPDPPRPSTRYVRNHRPLPVTVWALGARHEVAPRGAPRDTLALPSAAFRDPDLLGYLDLGWLEEIDEASALPRLATGRTLAATSTGAPVPGRRNGRSTASGSA